jgi:aminoglycoside 3-N-acetyltransferase
MPVTASLVERGVEALGVSHGDVVMVHASLSAVGWVVGGAETLVRAVARAVGPSGTVCAQTTWEDIPFHLASWPPQWRRAYLRELPPFDPEVSEAAHFEGRFAERLRTWPGAVRSANPGCCLSAAGPRARWLVDPHPLHEGFGPGSPYARLVEAGAKVLLLGAPLHSISVLHHAECLARVDGKRRTEYRVPLLRHGTAVWTTIRQLDVWRGPFPYDAVVPAGVPPFAHIAGAALATGIGTRGRIGEAPCHVFPVAELVGFATRWLEQRFRR